MSLLSRFDRPTLVFAALGGAAGLPYVVFTGTLFARLADAEVNVATIGVLSWIGLVYGFKFLWSPIVDRVRPLRALGRRPGWLILCQGVIAAATLTVAASDPARALTLIAAAALLGAFASATQDIAIDAWRIEAAETSRKLDTLSAAYQFGYRTASFLGGAAALILADATNWTVTFAAAALLSPLAAAAAALLPSPASRDAKTPESDPVARPHAPSRKLAMGPVLLGWLTAVGILGWFLIRSVTAPEDVDARAFLRTGGPWIVAGCVVVPGLAAAWLARLPIETAPSAGPLDRAYDFLLAPLVELIARLKWAALSALALILTYRFTDSVWGVFAYPFYLGADYGALGHTLSEVALASKTFGVVMTLLGVPLAGLAMRSFGRFPCLFAGAVATALTNLLFADLARGAPVVAPLMQASGLTASFGFFGVDAALARLMAVIAAENLSGGFATAVYVAYLSGLVSKSHAASQYALLFALTLMIGALGRGALGGYIETNGFAAAFVLTTVLGAGAVVMSAVEWARAARAAAPS